MSSVSFLTSELQALSKEAGRKHADVKEAADKALALLKSSPESALSDLHEESTSPGRQPVLLAPIVLGCSTKNPKVTSIAVSGLQRLTGVRGAITKNTVPTILTTLRSVLSQGVEIQLKILQTLVSLLTNCKDVHDDLLAETLLISFRLLESKIGVVSSTAAATLRQLVMFIFENVDAEDRMALQARADSSISGPVPTDFSIAIQANSPSSEGPSTEEPHYLLPAARDAYLVFDDICLLVNGEQPSFLKLQSLPRTFGLELIESVLSDFSNVFISHPELLHLLRTLLSPLLIRSLAEKPSFSTTLRLMRVMYLLLKKFNDHLIMESEIFLCIFIKIVAPGETEGSGGHPLSSSMLPTFSKDGKGGSGHTSGSGSSPPWMRVLSLEILRGLCGDFELLSKIWARYDAPQEQEKASTGPTLASPTTVQRQSTKVPVFTSMITALNKLATEKPALLGTGTAVTSGVGADSNTGEYSVGGVVDGIVGIAHQAASSVGVAGPSHGGLAMATATVKLQCIDQLDKSDAPVIPETYVFLLALQCLNAIGEGFAACILPIYSDLMSSRPKQDDLPLPAPPAITFDDKLKSENSYTMLKVAHDMAEAAWPALLASLSFYLTTNLDDDLFTYTLSSFQQFSTTCGILNLKTPRDAFLINLCKFAVPPPIISNLAVSPESAPSTSARPQLNSVLSAGADALGLSTSTPQPMSLSTRNLLCLRSLVHVSQALAGSLEKTWFYVFEALQNADLVLRLEISRRQKKKLHPPSAPGPNASPSKSSSAPPHHGQSLSVANNALQARYVPSDQDEQAAQARAARLFEISKVLDDSAFQWFVSALCRLNAEMVGIPISESGDMLAALDMTSKSALGREGGEEDEKSASSKQPKRTGINVIRTLRPGERSYAVTKLGDVSIMNMSRFISRPAAVGWNVVTGHLLVVQHWPNAPSIVRLQAADILDKIVTAASKELPDATDDRHRQNQEQLLEALKHQVEPQANRIPTSIDVEIRQAGLETLYRFVESQGHAISCGWATIFAILQTACSTRAESRLVDATVAVSAATTAKTAQLVRVAFPALQLICSDFLSALTVQEMSLCIDILTAFGRQTDDVNVALTAGNLLWQVSDHLQAARRQKEDANLYLDLWMGLLHSLLELCRDTRQEVRDGAIQILWRSIELYGASLDPASWEKCLSGVVFPLLAALNDGLASTETSFMSDEVEKTAMGIPLTHKQWDDSKILAINSAGTVFFNELPGEIATLDNFQQICKNFINYLQSSFLHDRPAVATAAAKALEKIASIQWDIAKDLQAAFVASELWNSWLEVGKILEEGSKQGLTQQNLEVFTNIMATLQARKHIDTTDNRILSLLGVLKTILTYPYSSDYRPDQDVMPPVQTTVVKVLDSIDLSSTTVASAVLQDLAEYMTLAYTTLSEAVKSPTLNDEPRLNQKVTYIALSKASTGRILDIFERFKDHAAVYESAIEAVLAAYAVPLRLKYDCPAPSKFGDDPPLWKTATLRFLQLVRGIVHSLNGLADNINEDIFAKIWRQIILGFQAILQADCRSVASLTLEQQRMEEDFDLAVIVTLETVVLPSLGQMRVTSDTILLLAEGLCSASRLYEIARYDTGHQLPSPSRWAATSQDSIAAKRAASGRLQDDCDTRDGSSSSSSSTTLIGTTVEEVELPRERFAYWCLDLLFLMAARLDTGSTNERKRIAILTLPFLLNRCMRVMRLYLADSEVRGKVPFARVRDEELVYILHHIGRLELDEGVFEVALDIDPKKEDPIKVLQDIEGGDRSFSGTMSAFDLLASACRRSKRAHLYEFYPQLLALATLPQLKDPSFKHTVPYACLDFDTFHRSLDPGTANHTLSSVIGGQSPPRDANPQELAKRCLDLVGQGFVRQCKTRP